MNEPVAWYNADDSSLSFKNHGGGWQPLYTHPAKTLTDEIEALKDGIEKLKDAYCQKDHEVKKAEQYCLDAFDRGRQIGYADGMISRKANK